MSSAKPTAQLIFPRWQINVLCSLGFTLFALPVCLWCQECLSPSWLLGWDAGGLPAGSAQSPAGQGCRGCCRLTAAMEQSGDWSLPAAGHGLVSGIARISIPWQACDTFTEVSDRCCTTDGWFAAALNHQGSSLSHREVC